MRALSHNRAGTTNCDPVADKSATSDIATAAVPIAARILTCMNTPPARRVPGSEFRANCGASHRRQDDPVVFQDQPGVSHMHELFRAAGFWSGDVAFESPTTYRSPCGGGDRPSAVVDACSAERARATVEQQAVVVGRHGQRGERDHRARLHVPR
ncbi:hypothetical protein ACWEIJ_35610 [Lentzea sp. NPDC004789]